MADSNSNDSTAARQWVSRETLVQNQPLPDGPYPDLIKRLLRARGLSNPAEIEQIFAPKMAQISDPLLIKNMQVAVDRLVKAYVGREKVCIYADFDLDGTSGLALLYEGLRNLKFAELCYYQPKRLSEGYGFHPHAVEDLVKQGVSLIVTVDVGITAVAAAKTAADLGIDVIITDHHQPGPVLPAAFAVVNPNQGGDTSGLNYLCGAGVAFYLLRAVHRQLIKNFPEQKFELDLKSLLDFFTIATLTDLVPLVGDNRLLVKHGLIQLQNTQRPGLRSLLEALNLAGRELTGQDVAIRFAPKLNALSRMEKGLLPVDLFLADDPIKAKNMVTDVLNNNDDRVSFQHNGEKLAQELLQNWPHSHFVFVASTEFHRGVVGLIATKLAQNWHRAAFVGSESSEGLIVGSVRVPDGGEVSALDALEAGSAHLKRFGGHHSAAGFELHVDSVPAFTEALAQHFSSSGKKRKPAIFEYDLDLTPFDLTPGFVRWLDALGPYGPSFVVPQFSLRDLTLHSIKELRGGHLKFQISTGSGGSGFLEALYFSPPGSFVAPKPGSTIDLLVEIQWNYFAGNKNLQLLVKDIVHRPKEIKHELGGSAQLGP